MNIINTLNDIKGNTAVVITLNNLIKYNKFPKFTILYGQMGVGKTSASKVIAESLLSDTDKPIYFETTSNIKLEDISFYTNHAPLNNVVLIMEEVHSLSKEEQTSLLSIIDNLPPTVFIIGTTTELHKILKPLQSRAQIFEFKRLSNSEMSSAMESYLTTLGKTLSNTVKNAILSKSKGIPRDMFKDIDLVINSNIDDNIATELFSFIDEKEIFTIFATIKSNVVEFIDVLSVIFDDKPQGISTSISNFWAKFMLCKLGGSSNTMDSTSLRTLKSLYEDTSELMLITKTLAKSTDKTIYLDLINICMKLNRTTNDEVRGIQIESQRTNNKEKAIPKINEKSSRTAKLSLTDISNIKL